MVQISGFLSSPQLNQESVPESAREFLSLVPNLHDPQLYTLVSGRNVLVPTESQVHEASCGQLSEKMGSNPLTQSAGFKVLGTCFQ